jgi:uncharacterized protein YuzE
MEKKMINNLQNSLPAVFLLLKSQKNNRLLVDYDKEADVLYVSFEINQKPDNTEIFSDNVLLRKKGKQTIGITLINASTYLNN